MLRILGWAPCSSGKMVLMFILGNKCNFFFPRFITLVSRYLGILVNKLASHQFPASKFVIEEGLEWWSQQPSPGLDFPPGVCSAAARWLGCAGGRAAGSSHCPAGVQPWPVPSSAPRHQPRWLSKRPRTGVPPDGFRNLAGGALGVLCPPPRQAPWVSALTGLSRSEGT